MDNKEQTPKHIRKRRGIVLTAIYLVIEVALMAGYYHTDSSYLFCLAIFLTPLACTYVGYTCFDGTAPQWNGKRWLAATTVLLLIALGTGWLIENH